MANDWSVKNLIREIVLSQTYQRASSFDADNYELDPENNSLWRANPRQLDAESLRDAMLVASQLLNSKRPLGSEVAKIGDVKIGRIVDKSSFKKLNVHRSVYLPILRDSIPESLALFDFADPNATKARREATNVPSQSLYLMNNEYVTYLSQHMALELSKEHETTIDQVRHAFLAVYGRAATREEARLSIRFFKQYSQVVLGRPGDAGDQEPNFRRRNRNGRQSFPNQKSRSDQQSEIQERRKQRAAGENRFGERLGERLKKAKEAKAARDLKDGGQRGARLASRMTSQLPKLTLSKEQQVLATFCQSLLASAEFRILN